MVSHNYRNQMTSGPVNAHLTSGPVISTIIDFHHAAEKVMVNLGSSYERTRDLELSEDLTLVPF